MGGGGDIMDGGPSGGRGKKFPSIPPPNQMPSYEKLFFLVYGQFPPNNYPIPQMPMQMGPGGPGGYNNSSGGQGQVGGSGQGGQGNIGGHQGGGGQSGGGGNAVGQNWNR